MGHWPGGRGRRFQRRGAPPPRRASAPLGCLGGGRRAHRDARGPGVRRGWVLARAQGGGSCCSGQDGGQAPPRQSRGQPRRACCPRGRRTRVARAAAEAKLRVVQLERAAVDEAPQVDAHAAQLVLARARGQSIKQGSEQAWATGADAAPRTKRSSVCCAYPGAAPPLPTPGAAAARRTASMNAAFSSSLVGNPAPASGAYADTPMKSSLPAISCRRPSPSTGGAPGAPEKRSDAPSAHMSQLARLDEKVWLVLLVSSGGGRRGDGGRVGGAGGQQAHSVGPA